MNAHNHFKIIVIDDNVSIHNDFIKILMSKPKNTSYLEKIENQLFGVNTSDLVLPSFEIETALQGKEGVEKISAALATHQPFALAYVDIRMPPGWDGIETIKKIWEIDPSIEIVICTAYSDYTWEDTINKLGQRDNLLILKKPFDTVAVRQLSSALTKKWQLDKQVKAHAASLESRILERTASLNKSLSILKATIESAADGVLVVENDSTINNYNKKFIEIWDVPRDLLTSHDFLKMRQYFISMIADSNNIFLDLLEKIDNNTMDTFSGQIQLTNSKTVEYYTQPFNAENNLKGRVWCFSDISKRAILEELLQYQATHDQLTSLPNRSLLNDRMNFAIEDAKYNNEKFAVLFIDLDRFKLINDNLSHAAGDEVLKIVAKRLQSLAHPKDTLARIGGDEFIFIVRSFSSNDYLISFCQRILDTFSDCIVINNREIILKGSIGICIYPEDGATCETLLRNADIAMYRAKELGADRFQFYTQGLSQKNVDQLALEAELRQAINNHEFVLYYQPQLDLSTSQLISVEVLVRWQHPSKGLVLPKDFIPLAEDSGLIIPLGNWIIRTACKQIKEWQNQNLPYIRVAINLSTKQFRLPNFVEEVKNILNEEQLDPNYIEFELTENMILNNFDMLHTVQELKNLGVHIALDDFGTGYSSLNYLREIPIDRIKIDQSYVHNIDSNRGDDVLIQAIITMAKNLNLDILAEGVETQRQVDFLKNLSCQEVQGFYFSHPLSVKDCEEFLKHPVEPKKK